MKRLTLLFLLSVAFSIVMAQNTIYSRIKIMTDQAGIADLMSKGVAIDDGQVKQGVWVICELSLEDIAIIASSGYSYEVLIPDVTRYYQERNAPFINDPNSVKDLNYPLNRDWPVPAGFELGPVGGFLTIDQAYQHLDDMAAQYPNLISPRYTLNTVTHEGRTMYWVRVSDNPTVNEDEPEVLYTGMHHARECIGMQQQIFYLCYLLENYATDPDVQYILNNFELYFIPIVNVDGYAENINTNPSGGGMWRKNKRDNGDGTFGVDLNRNYGYMWGYDDEGSSPFTYDETYRGPYAFSEPEITNIRDFCNDHEFKIALNYHSYAGLLLHAWGYTPDLPPDNDILHAYGEIMTKENNYTFGPGNTTIYNTNGGSDDWMYGEQTTKPKTFAYTPEVGNGGDGFWPSIDRIIPLCQESMWQNIMAARLCGPYATVTDISPSIIEETSGNFDFEIQRLGMDETGIYVVSITPLNDAIAAIGDPITYDNLEILETQTGSFAYTLKEGIQSGSEILYLLSVDNGFGVTSDTISKIFGTPVVIFEDDGNTLSKWTSSQWNITGVQYHSPDYSIADSPIGEYNNYDNNVMTLNSPIDITSAVYAVLNFWARWDIETGYDYVQVFATMNNGGTWIPLDGRYTKPGSEYQAPGQPVYDGLQQEWVQEEISLAGFLGYPIKLRFTLKSDSWVTADGFYWDDMTVTVVDNTIGISDPGSQNYFHLNGPVPNPAHDMVNFTYSLNKPAGSINLVVINNTGQVMTDMGIEGQNIVTLSVSGWSQGIYYYQFRIDGMTSASGKIIVK